MSKKRLLIIAVVSLMLLTSGCASLSNSVSKTMDSATGSDFVIYKHSGGEIVEWQIIRDKVLDNEEGSDGYYWTQNGRIQRISGDLTIRDISGLSKEAVINEYNLPPKREVE